VTDGLVLVHAFPLDASMWRPQAEAFGRRLPVVAPNLPGFGGTEGSGDVLTMDAGAERVVAEMDRAGVERGVVAGVSVGGYVAFALWRRHRERILGLLLADTRAEPDDDAGVQRRRAVAEAVRSGGTQVLVDAPPPLLSEDAPAELWEEVKATIGRQPAEAIAAASLGMAERPDSSPDLAEIDVPTLCVVGSADPITTPEVVTAMAASIGAEVRVIEGAGHLSNMEAPEEFNSAVADLLDRCGL
jgi:3-oxoadipate enol-lactonase